MSETKRLWRVAPVVAAFGVAGYMFYWGLASAASEGGVGEKSVGRASAVVKLQKADMGDRRKETSAPR